MVKKILIVEDFDLIVRLWRRALSELKIDSVVIVTASSIDEARERFKTNPDLDLIVMDAYIRGSFDRPNTLALVTEFRLSYSGPMLAQSSDEDHAKMLVDVGCNVACDKPQVPEKIIEILGLK